MIVIDFKFILSLFEYLSFRLQYPLTHVPVLFTVYVTLYKFCFHVASSKNIELLIIYYLTRFVSQFFRLSLNYINSALMKRFFSYPLRFILRYLQSSISSHFNVSTYACLWKFLVEFTASYFQNFLLLDIFCIDILLFKACAIFFYSRQVCGIFISTSQPRFNDCI